MSWMSELDALRTEAREALKAWESAKMGDSNDAEYEAGLKMEGVLHDFLRFTDQIAGGQPRQQACGMDGYSDWGRGPEQYWHCENPAAWRALSPPSFTSHLLMCDEHARDYEYKTQLTGGDDSARAE